MEREIYLEDIIELEMLEFKAGNKFLELILEMSEKFCIMKKVAPQCPIHILT